MKLLKDQKSMSLEKKNIQKNGLNYLSYFKIK